MKFLLYILLLITGCGGFGLAITLKFPYQLIGIFLFSVWIGFVTAAVITN